MPASTNTQTLTPITVAPPNLPVPLSTYSSANMMLLNNVLRLFFTSVCNALNQNIISDSENFGGTVTFTGGTSVQVTFSKPLPDTNYGIALSGNAAGYCWYSNKTISGFTINCSAANSNSTDWVAQS
jgi:hypothetical protein